MRTRVTERNWREHKIPKSEKPFWIVLTGAGVSAESGLKTFRDANGLWEGHDVQEVASPGGWSRSPEKVLEFYNQRRLQLGEVQPNEAHRMIAKMEERFEVLVVTQNVDDLHERAGSSHVLHLHGELTRVRSTVHSELIYDIGYSKLRWGDHCEKGSQLRPHIVWFGEAVPLYETAARFARKAAGILVVGTSLQVYPAAGLIHELAMDAKKVLIDPHPALGIDPSEVFCIPEKATTGMKKFLQILGV